MRRGVVLRAVFEPNPSGVDVDNQLNAAKLFTDETCGVAPFVELHRRAGRSEAPDQGLRRRRVRGLAEEGPGAARSGVVRRSSRSRTRRRGGRDGGAGERRGRRRACGENQPDGTVATVPELHEQATRRGTCTKLAKLRASLAVRLPEEAMDETTRENILDGLASA